MEKLPIIKTMFGDLHQSMGELYHKMVSLDRENKELRKRLKAIETVVQTQIYQGAQL